jgi:hypothetical protein
VHDPLCQASGWPVSPEAKAARQTTPDELPSTVAWRDTPRLAAGRDKNSAQECHRGLFVASLLDEDVQYEPVLIHHPPQPVSLPKDLQLHLVDMPLVGRPRPASTELPGVGCAEPAAPEADGFVTDPNAALSEQLFDVTMAQVEAEAQPDLVADDLRRETMATVEGGIYGHRAILPARGHT